VRELHRVRYEPTQACALLAEREHGLEGVGSECVEHDHEDGRPVGAGGPQLEAVTEKRDPGFGGSLEQQLEPLAVPGCSDGDPAGLCSLLAGVPPQLAFR
jgi:hypothetical protein